VRRLLRFVPCPDLARSARKRMRRLLVAGAATAVVASAVYLRWYLKNKSESAGGSKHGLTTAEAIKQKKTGPMPTGRKWKGFAVPFFFVEESAERFGELEMRADDVVMSSLGKGGTTWVHKILFLLLLGMDEDGNRRLDSLADVPGFSSQCYPEGCPRERPEKPGPMGKFSFEDLINQPAPRLISTHLWGPYLPKQLTSPQGKGKVVIVLRNLKDVLTSLHFFMGEAKDSWLGNEHGPGSFNRFIATDCPNAYGSPFDWVKQQQAVVDALEGTGRVKVVYFEKLKANLYEEVGALIEFLGLKVSAAKHQAVVDACTLTAMQNDKTQKQFTLRKGEIGDWKNYLDAETWARFDEAFETACGNVAIAAPLKPFHMY